MPEPLDEMVDGEPIRTHHKYWVKFTSKREETFKTIWKYSMKIKNPLLTFTAEDFTYHNALANKELSHSY